MPQVQFRCPDCGHKKLNSVTVNVAAYSGIRSIADHGVGCFGPDDPGGYTVTTSGFDFKGGEPAGYCCGGCNAPIPPATPCDLAEWLIARGMLSDEWSDEFD